jgi:hypothetical protein
MRQIFILFVLVLVTLIGCTREPADLAPNEKPQVAIASINGVDARNPLSDRIFVPASSIYDVEAHVTASDETAVTAVELFLNDASIGKLEPTTNDGTPTDFKNPFKFTLSTLTGVPGQATPAKLRATATDDTGQTSEYELDVLVDATPPVVEITSISGLAGDTPGSLQGSIVVSARAFDLESGIAFDPFEGVEVRAYLDGDESQPLNISANTETPQTAFTVNVGELEDGVHSVTLFARNNAAVFSGITRSFIIDKPEAEPTPPTP